MRSAALCSEHWNEERVGQLTNAWIRWWERMLDRPGAPERIVRVCWKHLAEAPGFLGDLQLPPLTELRQHSEGGWETQVRLDYVQHQHTWFKAVVLTVYTYLHLIHPLTPSHAPNRPPLKWRGLPIFCTLSRAEFGWWGCQYHVLCHIFFFVTHSELGGICPCPCPSESAGTKL